MKAILLALVAAAGCGASIQTTMINTAPHPMGPRPPASVEMFTSGPPARPHVDIALFEIEESSSVSTATTPDMLNQLRDQGARMGCDAVVLGGSSSREPGLNDAETWLGGRPKGRKGFTATCIAYTVDAAPIAAAPAAPPPAPAPPVAEAPVAQPEP